MGYRHAASCPHACLAWNIYVMPDCSKQGMVSRRAKLLSTCQLTALRYRHFLHRRDLQLCAGGRSGQPACHKVAFAESETTMPDSGLLSATTPFPLRPERRSILSRPSTPKRPGSSLVRLQLCTWCCSCCPAHMPHDPGSSSAGCSPKKRAPASCRAQHIQLTLVRLQLHLGVQGVQIGSLGGALSRQGYAPVAELEPLGC